MASIVSSSLSSWSEIWMAAITGPSIDNYEDIVDDPAANTRRAYIWILSSVTILTLVFLGLAVLRIPTHITPFRGLALGKGGSFPVSLSCGVPIAVVVAAIGFTVEVALLNFFASLIGGYQKDSSERLSAILAAIQSPMMFVYLVLFILPDGPLLAVASLLVSFYHLYLIGLALQTVYDFSWRRATIVLLLNIIVVTGIIFLFNLIVQH
jgi:hypothetical protein